MPFALARKQRLRRGAGNGAMLASEARRRLLRYAVSPLRGRCRRGASPARVLRGHGAAAHAAVLIALAAALAVALAGCTSGAAAAPGSNGAAAGLESEPVRDNDAPARAEGSDPVRENGTGEAASSADAGGSAPQQADGGTAEGAPQGAQQEEGAAMQRITVTVNGTSFSAVLEDNAAAAELAEMMAAGPVTVSLRDYGGFEKVGDLGRSLPAEDARTTTHAGDIVLYQGDQIVAFYGSNTWAYTRLARVENLDGWAEALGSGSVELTLALA